MKHCTETRRGQGAPLSGERRAHGSDRSVVGNSACRTPLRGCKRCSPGSWFGCSGPVPPFSLWKADRTAQSSAGVPLAGLAAGLLPFSSLSAGKLLPGLLHAVLPSEAARAAPPSCHTGLQSLMRLPIGFHSTTVSRETKCLRPTYCGGIQNTASKLMPMQNFRKPKSGYKLNGFKLAK